MVMTSTLKTSEAWPPPEAYATCKRCAYRWRKNTAKPKRCPSCLSYRWETPRPLRKVAKERD
jgi:hypothetical protein